MFQKLLKYIKKKQSKKICTLKNDSSDSENLFWPSKLRIKV